MYKINRFHIYLILCAAVLAEVVIVPYMQIHGAKPDIVLICVAFFGMFLGPSAGLETGLIAGFLRDIFTLDIFWMNAFIFGLAGLAAGALSSKFYRESRSTQFFFVFGLTAFSMCLHYILSAALAKSSHLLFGSYFFASVAPSSFYTSMLAVPVFTKFTGAFNLRDYRTFS